MTRSILSLRFRYAPQPAAGFSHRNSIARLAVSSAAALALSTLLQIPAISQVITIDTSGKGSGTANGPVDRRYAQIEPTHVDLPKEELNARTRLDLIRTLQSEQGFAMRPFPRGHKGLTLVANGKLEPAGESYLNLAVSEGICAKPGDRLVLTDVKIEHAKILFELNGGPDLKHRLLRHIEIGGGMGTSPVVQDDEQDPTGARLTLDFKGHIPDMTGAQVKALLAPLISFDVKTPIQAFTDTLPPQLKDAILSHRVLVGMSTDMVLYAKGPPVSKTREMDGQMPFEEWVYGQPPQDVNFVRINGNRVIRVEIAKMGQPIEVFTNDVVEGMMRTDGTPVIAQKPNTRTIEEGDAERDPNKEAPAAPPTLRAPGEATEPSIDNNGAGQMRPVQFPKPRPADQPTAQPTAQPTPQPAAQPTTQPGANPDDQPPAAAPAPSTPATQPAPASTQFASSGR